MEQMSHTEPNLTIDADLEARLSALAARTGRTVSDLAETVLRRHADEQERLIAELAEDEARWQHYLASRTSVAFDDVHRRLRHLAAEAAAKSEAT